MERASEQAPEQAPEAEPRGTPLGHRTAWPSPASRILALQRSAGNAAVARMLQREAARTGRVDSPVGIVYARADLESEHIAELPRDAPVPVKGRSGDFWAVDQGYVYFADVAVMADDQTAGAAVDTSDWRQVIPDGRAAAPDWATRRAIHPQADS